MGNRETVEAPTSTFTLLEKARTGDEAALSQAFEQYRRRLAVLIHFKLDPRDSADVEDVLQETYLKAFRALDGFEYRSPESFLRWLSSIADSVIVDRARYQGRERRAGEEIPFRSESNPLGPEPADTKTPSRLFAQEEALQRLLARLAALPDQYREVILMAKIEGLTTAEVAERLGKSRDEVAQLVFRAVKRLRAICEGDQ